MTRLVERIPANDPLVLSEKRQQIDRIIETNQNLPGATLVVLNELQAAIGYITDSIQAYVAQK